MTSELFPANTGGAAALCQELGLPFLGSLPLDPALGRQTELRAIVSMGSAVVDIDDTKTERLTWASKLDTWQKSRRNRRSLRLASTTLDLGAAQSQRTATSSTLLLSVQLGAPGR